MNLKKPLAVIAGLVFFSFMVAGSVWAQPSSLRQNAIISPQAGNTSPRVTNLKTKADKEIDRRLAVLNNLVQRINSINKLSDSSRSELLLLVQTDITTLTNLRDKIEADTDLSVLKTDVQSIVKDYRVYVLARPKIGLVIAADTVLANADKLTTISAKLQTRITQEQSAGKDVSALESTYKDMQAKIADAQTQAKNAQSTVASLTPEGYPANKSTLLSALKMLKTARQDLQAARNDAHTIIQGIKDLEGLGSTPPSTSSSTTSK